MALASIQGRHSLRRIHDVLGSFRTRQTLAYFLTSALWDAPALLRQKALDTLKELHYRLGDPLYLVLDDTQKRKRGRLMQAVSKIFLHAEGVYARGHTIVGCAFVYRGVLIPCALARIPKAAFRLNNSPRILMRQLLISRPPAAVPCSFSARLIY